MSRINRTEATAHRPLSRGPECLMINMCSTAFPTLCCVWSTISLSFSPCLPRNFTGQCCFWLSRFAPSCLLKRSFLLISLQRMDLDGSLWIYLPMCQRQDRAVGDALFVAEFIEAKPPAGSHAEVSFSCLCGLQVTDCELDPHLT